MLPKETRVFTVNSAGISHTVPVLSKNVTHYFNEAIFLTLLRGQEEPSNLVVTGSGEASSFADT